MTPGASRREPLEARTDHWGRRVARLALLGVVLAAVGWVYEVLLHFAVTGGQTGFAGILFRNPDPHDPYERLGFLFLVVATGLTVAWASARRRQAELALRDSEERYRLLVDHAPVGIAVYVGGRTVFANAAAMRMMRVSDPADFIGRNVMEFVHPDYRGIVAERMREMARTGRPAAPLEEQLVRPDGTAFDVEMVAVPTMFNGEAAVQAVFADITERKQAEAVLRESEAKFRAFSEQSLVGIAVIQDGEFKYVNPRVREIFGYDADEFREKTPGDLVVPQDWPAVYKSISRRTDDARVRENLVFRGFKKDGETIHLELHGSATTYNGKPASLGSIVDITDRKLAEEALQKALDELEGQRRQMGELARKVIDAQEQERKYLAAEIHDDFLQGLVATSFFLQSMDLGALDAELGKRKRRLEEVVQACIEKGRLLIAEIEPIREPGMRLIPAVQKSIDISLASSGILARFNHPDALNEISLHDDINILRIIQEALMNVRKHSQATEVTIDITAEPDRLVVSIADDGSGFDADAVPEGPVGHYGLLTMRERAGLIGGTLTVESTPGQGTTVRGVFPITRVDYPN